MTNNMKYILISLAALVALVIIGEALGGPDLEPDPDAGILLVVARLIHSVAVLVGSIALYVFWIRWCGDALVRRGESYVVGCILGGVLSVFFPWLHLGGIIAHNRGNSYWGGFLLSVFAPLGWLIALLMRKDYRALEARKEQ